ncbi:MAG: glycosyltransferase family 39 protein, partial [Patescibacteria group bacterium]
LATMMRIWGLARELISTRVAIIATFFYAISPLVIVHSHSSWNPNVLPFWSLLIIYGLLKVVVKHDYKWICVVGASLGIALQLHYVALVFIPIVVATLGLIRWKLPWKYWLGVVGSGIITYSPFILFELRHQFINSLTVWQFVTRGGDAKTFGLLYVTNKIWDLVVRLFWRLVVIENAEISILFLGLISITLIWLLFQTEKNIFYKKALKVLLTWLAIGIGVLAFYTGTIYDYYLMFAFPLPFILLGIVGSYFLKFPITKWLVILIIVLLAYFELKVTPISKPPNRLKAQTKEIADFVLEKAENKPMNFGLIAAGNSDHAYRYFLEIGGNAPVVIEPPDVDPERQSVMQQLFVVCEEKVCLPLGHSRWEIAGFGRGEIVSEWQVGLFKVFKLIPYSGV